MFRVINEYLTKVKLQANDEICSRLNCYVTSIAEIKKANVNVNFNRYIIDIKLKNFSVEEAARIFSDFSAKTAYSYSSIYVRYNEGSCVRYRFITCKEDKEGFYCDLIFA